MKLLGCVLLVLAFFSIALVPGVHSFENLIFEDYSTSYFVRGNTLLVEKEVILRNVGQSEYLVPGEIYFNVYERKGDSSVAPKIRDVSALQNNNQELETRIDTYDTHSTIAVRIWAPLSNQPNMQYRLSLSYEMDFRPKGFLFHEVVFPVETSSHTIVDRSTRMMLPTGYTVTYAPSADVSTDGLHTIVDWGSRSDLSLEYTFLPLPEQMPFRMVSVFWLTVLVFLGVLFIFLNLRRTSVSKKK